MTDFENNDELFSLDQLPEFLEQLPIEPTESILDILLDHENDQNIFLYDENSNPLEFEQVAVIPMNDRIYAILKPVTKIDGIEENEAIVFVVEIDEEGAESLVVERDEATAVEVFKIYHQLLEEEGITPLDDEL